MNYEEYRKRCDEISECIQMRIEKYGETFEEAEKQCEESRYAEQEQITARATEESEEVQPRILEKTFCGFCSELHPTAILRSNHKVKSIRLDSYHIKPAMQVDSLGLTREATEMERCMSARMDVMGLSEEAAREECEFMLNDPMFRHQFLNKPTKYEQRANSQTEEDLFVAEYATEYDIHPEMAKAIYEQRQREASRQPVANKEVSGLQNIFGKTKTELIAESLSPSKYAGRMTVGDIFTQKAKAKAERERLLKEDLQPEQSPLDRCIKNRMELYSETYEKARQQCMNKMKLNQGGERQ